MVFQRPPLHVILHQPFGGIAYDIGRTFDRDEKPALLAYTDILHVSLSFRGTKQRLKELSHFSDIL